MINHKFLSTITDNPSSRPFRVEMVLAWLKPCSCQGRDHDVGVMYGLICSFGRTCAMH